VLPFGKPTYVDKTFAPDLATARRIFALADRYGAPLQTSSALRYTNVQEAVRAPGAERVQHMVTWGGGSSFGEYAIHPVELAVSCLGPEAERLMRRGTGDQSQLLIDFSGGRTAVVNVYTNANTAFAASLTTGKGTSYVAVDGSRIFINMAAAILDLFETGTPNIDRRESLTIRRLLDLAAKPASLQRFIKV
jgi:predicted dehydrogenase